MLSDRRLGAWALLFGVFNAVTAISYADDPRRVAASLIYTFAGSAITVMAMRLR